MRALHYGYADIQQFACFYWGSVLPKGCQRLVNFPDFSGVVGTCGDDMSAVRTENRVPHFVVVPETVKMFSCFGIPDFCGVVEACGDGVGATRTENHGGHAVVVLESMKELPCFSIPNFCSVIPACGDGASAIRTENRISYDLVV